MFPPGPNPKQAPLYLNDEARAWLGEYLKGHYIAIAEAPLDQNHHIAADGQKRLLKVLYRELVECPEDLQVSITH